MSSKKFMFAVSCRDKLLISSVEGGGQFFCSRIRTPTFTMVLPSLT